MKEKLFKQNQLNKIKYILTMIIVAPKVYAPHPWIVFQTSFSDKYFTLFGFWLWKATTSYSTLLLF